MQGKQRIPSYMKLINNEPTVENIKHKNNFLWVFVESYRFIKENWQVTISLTFSFMVLISRNVYTELFSGDSDTAIKFTQEYYSNNLYRVVFYFCIYAIFFAGLIISLSRIVSYEDIKKKIFFGSDKGIEGLEDLSIKSCSWRSLQGGVFFTVTAVIICLLTDMFTFKSFLHGFIFYVIFFILIFVPMMLLNLCSVESIKFAYKHLYSSKNGSNFYKIIILSISRNFIVSICTSLVSLLIVLFPAFSTGSYGYIDVAYRKGYIACISSDDGSSSKNGIPISYDSRGVHIFTGEYYSDESLEYHNGINVEKGYRWRNVHREYLQFEKGYKITSGACKTGSGASSVPPLQGQQLP